MAIRREGYEDGKIKKERVSKSPDSPADPPSARNEPLIEDAATTGSYSTNQEATRPSSQQDGDQVSTKVSEETKQNLQRASREEKDGVPKFTKAVNTYQEQQIQACVEAVEDYFEMQKQLVSSIQTSWIPNLEDTAKLFWNSFLAPQRMLELYANSIANFADACILANRTINYYFLENIETLNNNMEKAKQISNDLASACMNLAKTESKKIDNTDNKNLITEAQAEVTTTKTKKE
jgi:hypothetical protein